MSLIQYIGICILAGFNNFAQIKLQITKEVLWRGLRSQVQWLWTDGALTELESN